MIAATKPIDIWSRLLTSPDRRPNTTQLRCLFILWSVLLLRLYLEVERFSLRGDHGSLKRILNLSVTFGGLVEIRLWLCPFGLDGVHRAELKSQATDAFSRKQTVHEKKTDLDHDLTLGNFKIIQKTNDEKYYIQDCTKCNVENQKIAGKPDEGPT